MKLKYILLTILIYATSVLGQTPEKLNYQAVIRNSNGELITNKTIGMKISIMEGSSNGSLIYTETQTVSTNAQRISNNPNRW